MKCKQKDNKNENKQQNCSVSLYNCIVNLHKCTKIQELKPLFQQMNADIGIWQNIDSTQQKSEYLLNCLQKNIMQNIKKITNQPSNYINMVNSNRKHEKQVKLNIQKNKNKSKQFQWLTLNTKNQMLKSKLKTKLVQTINQYKNQKKLREVQGKQLEDHEKIHLEDQSIDFYQDQSNKINYQWSINDEQMFIQNVRKLKQKFTQTQFLKNCHRYKFITDSQLKTLACQQISRKLDKSNKAFLSRQFLLDKYFSTKQTLTEKQMKFILKTSPLLSKCVDKAFVRAAIKNIQYQDIDKMELDIAEQIIEKFQMIRNLVKNSRKLYKQKQNNNTKQKIQMFQREKQFKQTRASMNQKLNIHKSKMMRNLQYRPNTAKNFKNTQSKQNFDHQHQIQYQVSQKISWPIPLNSNHPATGLFIRDCSEQINDQFNEYEKNYLKNIFKDQNQNVLKKSQEAKAAMIKFYTGGPIDSLIKNNINSGTKAYASCGNSNIRPFSAKQKNGNNINSKSYNCYNNASNTVKAMCQAFKVLQYKKQITQKLNSFDLEQGQQGQFLDKKSYTAVKSVADFCLTQFSKRTKKSDDQDNNSIISPNSINNNVNSNSNKVSGSGSTQKIIKDRILQGRQKAKMNLYTKKLLSLAAQNAFLSLKAMDAKFTPSQINSIDAKGNTALFYATKNKNVDFIDYLLAQKADVNIRCSKGTTPLHNAFRSSNYSIICKCLSSSVPPNLNVLDDELKTPLAYCCRKVLEMLGLQEGVVSILPSQKNKIKFNNNLLLVADEDDGNGNDQLEFRTDIRRKNINNMVMKDAVIC